MRKYKKEEQFVTTNGIFRYVDYHASAQFFNDIMASDGGVVEGTFDQNYFEGQPAVVRNDLGKGSVYYFSKIYC